MSMMSGLHPGIPPENASNRPSKTAVLVLSTLAFTLPGMANSAVNVALPMIGRQFSMDAVLLSWVPTAFMVTSASLLIPFGRFSDIHGRRGIFTGGVLILALASGLGAASISSGMIILARVGQGIGSAMIFATAMAMLTAVYPGNERGHAIGINTAAAYVGMSAGPFIGGMLTRYMGWRGVFIFCFVLALATLIGILWRLKGDVTPGESARFDTAGSAILVIGLFAITYGLSLLPDIPGILLIVIGSVALIGFVMWENRCQSPVLNMALFKHNRGFTLSNVAAFTNYAGNAVILVLLSLYLQYIKGLPPDAAGTILIIMPVTQAIVTLFTGRLTDRMEPRVPATAGMVISCIGLMMLTFIGQETAMSYIYLSLVVLGIGFGSFVAPNSYAIMSTVDKGSLGVASAIVANMRQMGIMLGLGLTMLLFNLFIGRVEITPEYYPGFLASVRVSFAISTAFCFVGIFASMARGHIQATDEPSP